MYDEYYEKKEEPKKKKFDFNMILNIIMIIIGIIMVIVIIKWISNPSEEETETHTDVVKTHKYENYEKSLEEAAEKYYASHVLSSSEKYLSASALGVNLPNNCSFMSGVITSGNLNKAYLLCSDYESEIMETNKNSSIQLVGKSIYMMAKGTKFIDPGYVSRDAVTVSGSVGDSEGIYNIFYISRDNNTVVRKVIVTDDKRIKDLYPTIKLKGEENVYIVKNSQYKDEGATATDPEAGDISNQINKSGKVNTSEVGEYKILYSVTNKRGFTVTTSRSVTVLNDISELVMNEEINPTGKTNQSVTIKMNVLGENYAYSYLPSAEKITDREFSYVANDNGTYHFWAYDTYGRKIEKIVKIGNIDRATPTFTCDANVYGNHVDLIVTSISKPISKYKYTVNGQSSDFLEQTSYVKMTNDFQSASIEIIDNSGNHATNTCNVVKKDPTIGNNNIRYFSYGGTEYVIANTKNDLGEFVNQTAGKISQSVFSGTSDPDHCTSQCLGFSQYHAGFLQEGNIYNMNANSACHYNLIKGMTHTFYQTKEETLGKIFEEITNGRVCVLQVTASSARNSRHFVLVVGYNREKYTPGELREEDLLTIDSWTGNFCTLSEADLSKRAMFYRQGQGYRIDHFT